MEIAAGAELRQKARPFRRLHGGVEPREERVIQHLENLPLRPRPPFLIPARKLLPVHHLRREESGGRRRRLRRLGRGGNRLLELGQVDGADVAGAETVEEAEIGEGEGGEAAYGVPAGVAGGVSRGMVLDGGGGGEAGGGGRPIGAGAGGAVDIRGGGGGGGVEAHALEIVGQVVDPWLHLRRRRGGGILILWGKGKER